MSDEGIGTVCALFITFLVLKLTHVTDWSWWWVTSPLWIAGALVGSVRLLNALAGDR